MKGEPHDTPPALREDEKMAVVQAWWAPLLQGSSMTRTSTRPLQRKSDTVASTRQVGMWCGCARRQKEEKPHGHPARLVDRFFLPCLLRGPTILLQKEGQDLPPLSFPFPLQQVFSPSLLHDWMKYWNPETVKTKNDRGWRWKKHSYAREEKSIAPTTFWKRKTWRW